MNELIEEDIERALIEQRLFNLKTTCIVCENDPETCFHCPWRIEIKLFEYLKEKLVKL